MHFLKSLIYPAFSPSFYRESVLLGGKKALKVYFLFTVLISFLTFIYFAATVGYDLYTLPQTMEKGDFPEISIENGTLSVTPEKTYDFSTATEYVVIDTTGATTEIPSDVTEGVLFTNDHILIRSTSGYSDQEIPYDEVLSEFDIDSFNFTHDSVVDLIRGAGLIVIIVSPLFIFFGLFVSRLISIFLISLLGVIALSIMGESQVFRKSLIIAVYASIPVYYVGIIASLIGKGLSLLGIDVALALSSICCLIPLLFSLIKWGIFMGIGIKGVQDMD